MTWLNRLLRRTAATEPKVLPVERPARPDAGSTSSGGFAVVDVETTGLSPRSDRVVSIGVVLLDPRGRTEHEWSTLVDPQGPVGATHIHGICDADVVGAPVFAGLVEPLVGLLRGRVLAGHNISFDQGFLKYEFGRAGWGWPTVPTLCTLKESMYFLPHLDRRRLPDCCWASGISLDHAHSALHDARATAQLLAYYLDPHRGLPPLPAHRTVVALAASTPWPTHSGTGTPARPDAPRRVLTERARYVIAHRDAPLGSLLERFTLTDALDDGATPGALAYLETLLEALEDGHLSATERATLSDVAELYELSEQNLAAAHRGFVRALAHEALDDGHLSRAEKAEITHIAGLLDVPDSAVRDLLEGEEAARLVSLSAHVRPLPDDWPLGEPLRVGDRVAFTGCDPAQRDALERQATACGVRVLGNVSRRTVMLVTDGSYDGIKARAAQELGTRVVHPDDFHVMLEFIQPWTHAAMDTPPAPADAPRPSAPSPAGATRVPTYPAGGAPARVPASVVRAWAIDRGLAVGVRGRLSAEVWDAYARESAEPTGTAPDEAAPPVHACQP